MLIKQLVLFFVLLFFIQSVSAGELKGLLLKIEDEAQWIDLGSEDGVTVGLEFSVTKDGVVLAKIEVAEVEGPHKSKTVFVQGARAVFIEPGFTVVRAVDLMVEDKLLLSNDNKWKGLRDEEQEEIKRYPLLPALEDDITKTEWLLEHLSWVRNLSSILNEQLVKIKKMGDYPNLEKALDKDCKLFIQHLAKIENGSDFVYGAESYMEEINTVQKERYNLSNAGVWKFAGKGRKQVVAAKTIQNVQLRDLVGLVEKEISAYAAWVASYKTWLTDSGFKAFIEERRQRFNIESSDLPFELEMEREELEDSEENGELEGEHFAPVRY